MMSNRRSFLAVAMVCGLISASSCRLHSQQPATTNAQAQPSTAQDEPDPLKRQRSDKEQFQAQREVKKELKGAFKTWLDQDVAYIISDEERKAFKNLSNDE